MTATMGSPSVVMVWVPETLSPSRDPGVFADEAAETVSPQNTHAALLYGWMDAPGGRTLLQRPVRPMSVVLVGVLREGTAGTAARPAGVMRPVLA